jgi:sucrose-6-phosphate hydrolase SacC (GH32 family)
LPKAEAKEGYAFAYFTGNDIAGENIFMAASRGNDALKWDELNGGQPVLKSGLGTKGLRDPFIIRSPEGDKFYMIATDLSIGSGTSWDASQRRGSQHLEVWESTDLVNWSEQRHVKVSPDTATTRKSAPTSSTGPPRSTPTMTRTMPAAPTTK